MRKSERAPIAACLAGVWGMVAWVEVAYGMPVLGGIIVGAAAAVVVGAAVAAVAILFPPR